MAEEAVVAAPGRQFSPETQSRAEMLMGLTLRELVELRDCLKAHGIEPASGGVVVAGAVSGGGAEGAPQQEEKTAFDVVLEGFGDKKIGVIKEVRAATGLGLKEAKDLVEGCPSKVKEGLSKEEAEALKAKLEAAGATVSIK